MIDIVKESEEPPQPDVEEDDHQVEVDYDVMVEDIDLSQIVLEGTGEEIQEAETTGR